MRPFLLGSREPLAGWAGKLTHTLPGVMTHEQKNPDRKCLIYTLLGSSQEVPWSDGRQSFHFMERAARCPLPWGLWVVSQAWPPLCTSRERNTHPGLQDPTVLSDRPPSRRRPQGCLPAAISPQCRGRRQTGSLPIAAPLPSQEAPTPQPPPSAAGRACAGTGALAAQESSTGERLRPGPRS